MKLHYNTQRILTEGITPQNYSKNFIFEIVLIYGEMVLERRHLYSLKEKTKVSAKAHRKKTAQNPDQFSVLFQNNPLPMWVYDLETLRFIEVNEAAVKHYGYARAEFLRMRLPDIRPKEDIARIKAHVRAKRQRLQNSGEWRHLKKDGTLIYVEIVSHMLTYKGRKSALIVAKDITESKQAHSALRESQAELKDVIDSAMDAIILVDDHQRVVLFNPAAEKIFQYSAAEVVGKSLGSLIPQPFRKTHHDQVLKFGKSGTTRRSALHMGWVFGLRADGTKFPAEVAISAVKLSGKKFYTAILRDISERIRAEGILRESESQYKLLFESAPVGIGLTDSSGRFLNFNDAILKPGGYHREDVTKIGNVNFLYADPAQRKRVLSLFRKQGYVSNYEVKFKRKDGSIYEALLSLSKININGKPCMQAIVEDITQRKRAEELLRLQVERFQVALGAIDIAVFNQDKRLRYTWISQPQLGYQAEQVIGKTDAELLSPQDALDIMRIKRAVIESGRGTRNGIAVHTPDKTLFYDLIVEPLKDGSGEVIGLTGASLDITEQRHAEEILRESEERFRSLYENTTIGIYRTTPDGQILMSNPAMVKMLEYESFEELASRNLEKDGNDAGYSRKIFKKLIEHEGMIRGREASWKTKRGNTIYVRESAHAVRDEKGKVLYYDGTIEDITERKKAEEALRASESELRALFSAIPDLIMVLDKDGRYLKIASSNPDLVYQPADDLIGKRMHDIFSRQKADRLVKYIRRALRTQKPVRFEYAVLVGGKIVWFSAVTAPLTKETVVWVARDISSRKQTEEQTQHRLIELQALYESGLAFGHTMDINAIGEQIIHVLRNHFYWDQATVRLRREDSDEVELIAFSGGRNKSSASLKRALARITRVGQGLSGWVIEHGETVRVGDLTNDIRYIETFTGTKSGLYVPMKIGEIAIGVISVESNQSEAFDEDDERLLTTLATQAASAIHNARLFGQTQRRAMESATLYEVTSEVATLNDVPSLLQTIAKDLAMMLGVPGGVVYLYDLQRSELKVVATTDSNIPVNGQMRLGEGMTGRIAQSREPMIVEDYKSWVGAAAQYKDQPFYSVLGVPMLYGGELVGVLVAHGLHATSSAKESNRKFTERDVHLLSLFASAAAGAVYSARLLEDTRRRALESTTLYEITSELAMHNNLSTLLNMIAKRAATLLNVAAGGVYLYDSSRQDMEIVAATHDSLILGTRLQLGEGMAGRVAQTHEPLIIDNYQAWPLRSPQYVNQPFASVLEVPMLYSGELIGVLVTYNLHSKENDNAWIYRKFTEGDIRLLSLFASAAAGAVYSARLLDSERKRRLEAETLQRAAAALTSSLNTKEILNSLLDELASVIPFNGATVFISEGNFIRVAAEKGADSSISFVGQSIPLEDSIEEYVLELRAPLILADAQADTRFHQFNASQIIRGWMGVPLIVHEKLVGYLSMGSDQPNAFNELHAELALAIGNQAATAIENARLFQDAVRYAQRWATLHAVSQELARVGEDLEQVYAAIHHAVAKLMPIEVFTITLVVDKRSEISAVYLYDRGERSPVMQIPFGKGFSSQVIESGVSIKIDDDWESPPVDLVMFGAPDMARSILAVPLRVSDKVIGAMSVQSYQPNIYSSEDQLLLELLATQAAIAIENTRLFDKIRQRAHEFEALFETTREISLQQNSGSLLKIIVERAAELLHSPTSGFYLYDAQHQELVNSFSSGLNLQTSTRLKLGEGASGRVALSREPILINDYQNWEGRSLNYEGIPFRAVLAVPMLYSGELIGVIDVSEIGDSERIFTQDDANLLSLLAAHAAGIVHNARLLDQLKERVEQFSTLHSIDLVIGSTTDLRVSLQVVLESIMRLLKIDAAEILLYNSTMLNLEYADSVGFRSSVTRPIIRLGEGLAGHVALTRQILDIPELANVELPPPFRDMIDREGFISYRCLPLIAKGEVKGVLELYHRSAFPSDLEWSDLLNLLTSQAAIAMDNAMLFSNLEYANTELELAYDATIEGWSQALELRDHETSGHTRRMLDTTIALAHKMGIPDSELPSIRRGVLLHDIGKMGVPDQILLKPGPLNEEEWKIMHQHPLHAYNLLSKIAYLRPALDIPYYHHEKWDGSGYPRGLKGEQIPISARIFAVVDVYDALSFDRSYRSAWPKEKVIAYIKEQSGKYFDPRVVETFLGMVG